MLLCTSRIGRRRRAAKAFCNVVLCSTRAGYWRGGDDDGEIKAHQWISPADALARHAQGEIDLVPPTWVTLYHLNRHSPSARVLEKFRETPVKVYATRVVKDAAGQRVAMWRGDGGYDAWDADADGGRHRLVMASTGFEFISIRLSVTDCQLGFERAT